MLSSLYQSVISKINKSDNMYNIFESHHHIIRRLIVSFTNNNLVEEHY